MLKVSRLADYAITVMCALANEKNNISANELAEQINIAPTTVSKLLKQLAKAKLVSSLRGATGGYQLAKTPEAISLCDVMVAIDGPVALTECATISNECTRKLCCNMQDNWQVINGLVNDVLQQFSIKDMLKPIKGKIRRRAVFDIQVESYE